MIDVKSRLKGVTDSQKWAARGASFVAKTKATNAVWFPPRPVETGEKAASTAKRATKKTTGAAKKTAGAAAKKTTKSTKKVTNPVGRKKS